jgi:hypothetical protein
MLYERFGISEAGIDPARQERLAQQAEEGVRENPDDLCHHLSVLVSMNIGVATRYYLLEKHPPAEYWAGRALLSAVNYFLGDWRAKVTTDEGTIDPSWWHGREGWLHDFRGALCWGTVLGRWDDVRRLAAYPDERREVETLDATPALRRLVIDTARHLRGEQVRGVAAACAKLDGPTWRGTDALAAALDAVVEMDEARARSALGDFFLRHHKRKKSKDVTDTVSLDGTTMLNVARRAGLNVSLDPKLQPYYIRLA